MTASRFLLMSVLSRVSDISRPRKVEERVNAKIAESKCLGQLLVNPQSEETVDCDGKMGPRGLCDRCRTAYYRELHTGTPDDQLAFETKMIREGLVLKQGEMKQKRSKSLYRLNRRTG